MSGMGVVVFALGLVVFAGPILARLFRRQVENDVADDFEPTVTVITPMFNEGESIRRTIESILAQNYPRAKLSIIVVDDCSTDDSYEHALAEISGTPRATVLRNKVNLGKRRSINRAVRRATSEIIVSVDSDVLLDPDAVRNLVRRFTCPRIAAVGGRVDILNRENWLTRMQAVEYYFGYQFLKGLERSFRAVMCLSGCLTAYRRSVLLELEPLLEGRNILGVAIKYGEDRFLTRQIIKAGYQTTMTLDAVCRTSAPNTLHAYFAQQLRWRRSNIVDYVGGMSHVWRLHSVVAVHYYSVFALILAYPVLLLQSLLTGTFWLLMTVHVGWAAGTGLVYASQVRKLPADRRVSAWDALPLAIVLPVSYAVMTLLAILTLDSAKWETRGHLVPDIAPPEEVDDVIAVAEPVIMAEPIAIAAAARATVMARQPAGTTHDLHLLTRTRRVIRRRLVESRRFTASESWPALTAAPHISHGDRRK
ncbi:MAG TPA: glycosyltransferase [Kofleriaceae bacterium]|nr:glycosyltransferase [Kofleriaceae bacterium]